MLTTAALPCEKVKDSGYLNTLEKRNGGTSSFFGQWLSEHFRLGISRPSLLDLFRFPFPNRRAKKNGKKGKKNRGENMKEVAGTVSQHDQSILPGAVWSFETV